MNIKKLLKYITSVILALSLCLGGCMGDPGPAESSPEASSSESDIPVMGSTDAPPSDKKRVALTFDDGPHNVRTREIVDELDKYGFRATFFVVGNRVDGGVYHGGDTVKYVLDHGNEVGIHGYTHTFYYDTCDESDYRTELARTAAAIHMITSGYKIKLMRPVGGRFSEERLEACKYASILWDVDSEDWQHKYYPDSELTDAEKAAIVDIIVDNVMSSVSDGSIILMHDIYLSTSDAVKVLLQRLDEAGYEVVTVSELLGEVQAGEEYRRK